MNLRQTYILFGIVFGLVLLFGFTQLRHHPPKNADDFLFPSFQDKLQNLKTEDINTVEIKRLRPTEEKIVLVRSDKGWELHDPLASPVYADSQAVDELVRQVANVRKETLADVTNDPAKFGLDAPSAVITFKNGAERAWTLTIGEESPDKSVVYANSNENKQPVAIRRSGIESLLRPVVEFRSKDLLPVTAFNATAVELVARDAADAKKTALLGLTREGEKPWTIAKPFTAEADVDGEGLESKERPGIKGLLTSLGGLRVDSNDDFVKNDVQNFGEYGLDENQAILKATATYTRESRIGSDSKSTTETLLVGKKVDDKGTKYFARLNGFGNRSVVKVDGKKLESVLHTVEHADNLRNRDLVAIDPPKVDALTIRNGRSLIKLRKVKELWRLTTDDAPKPVAAEFLAVKTLIDALAVKRQVKGFPDQAKAAELGLNKPENEALSVSLWEEGVEKTDKLDEEPKLKEPDKPKFKLILGREDRDKAVVAVKRIIGSQEAILDVPNTLVTQVARPKLAYLDRAVPSFTGEEPVKLVLTRSDGTYEIDKEKKDDKGDQGTWTIKQPKELVGRHADPYTLENIFRELRELHALNFVVEKPSEAKLDEYGLRSPQAKAVVTVRKPDGKTEERSYLFGKASTEAPELYARLDTKTDPRDLVFTVRPDIVTGLQGELRDRVLFTIDVAKVKELTISGWRAKYNFSTSLTMERQANNTWKVKKAPFEDFARYLDNTEVDVFVATLSTMRAEQFLKGGAKPEYELDPEKRGLQIEVILEGGKQPLTLTVGKADGTKGYFGQASTHPGEAVLLPQMPFKKLLDDGINFFKSKQAPAGK